MFLDRIVHSRLVIAYALAAITGVYLFFNYPVPSNDPYLQVISLRSPHLYTAGVYTYTVMLFSTPFILYSATFSLLYIFVYRRSTVLGRTVLPPYPSASRREKLYLVLGEVHDKIKPQPSPRPYWLTIPERGLFTGIAVFGAIGTGKTSCCIRPFAEQLLAHNAEDPERRIGGLVLEVKGDFCHQVRDILKGHGREKDYVEISLGGEYCYNPLQNDLDAYALAYALSSLIHQLFGKGKDPFWSMAATNVVKFIILLHKLVDDYVTLYDVYLAAIKPDALALKLEQGRNRFSLPEYVDVADDIYGTEPHNAHLHPFNFVFDDDRGVMVAEATDDLRAVLEAHDIPHTIYPGKPPEGYDPDKVRQFHAVERWFHHDWMSIDRKLRTSIVEGISVFLSLFDDNPEVHRIFCPPRQCYEPDKNTVDESGKYKYGRPLPSFSWLIEQGKVCALNFPVSLNPGLAKALGTLMKMDFQRAVLLRIPEMARHPERHFREVAFICDEYQNFATAGENDPNGDEKFFSSLDSPSASPSSQRSPSARSSPHSPVTLTRHCSRRSAQRCFSPFPTSFRPRSLLSSAAKRTRRTFPTASPSPATTPR
jgi:hypothetical protein